jgi:hypothetical protein
MLGLKKSGGRCNNLEKGIPEKQQIDNPVISK